MNKYLVFSYLHWNGAKDKDQTPKTCTQVLTGLCTQTCPLNNQMLHESATVTCTKMLFPKATPPQCDKCKVNAKTVSLGIYWHKWTEKTLRNSHENLEHNPRHHFFFTPNFTFPQSSSQSKFCNNQNKGIAGFTFLGYFLQSVIYKQTLIKMLGLRGHR